MRSTSAARRFREQLEYLGARGVASLDDGVAAVRRSTEPIDDRPRLAVTFDDGTADFVESALPLLVEFGVPATLYIATQWVDEGRSFWDDGTVLSWAALREAASTGLVTFGSHTHTHALLDRLPTDEIDVRSRPIDRLDRGQSRRDTASFRVSQSAPAVTRCRPCRPSPVPLGRDRGHPAQSVPGDRSLLVDP